MQDTNVRKNCGRTLWGLTLLACFLGPTGCHSTPSYQGAKHDIVATYQYRKLRTDLPGTVRVPAAIAAAEAVLRNRGYAVRTSVSTEDEGRVEAMPPEAGVFEEIVVRAEAVGGATRVEILIEPFGDQVKSRAIMDGILTRLGL